MCTSIVHPVRYRGSTGMQLKTTFFMFSILFFAGAPYSARLLFYFHRRGIRDVKTRGGIGFAGGGHKTSVGGR